MANKRCPHCGKKISAGARYCLYCMYRFDETVEPEQADESIAPIDVDALLVDSESVREQGNVTDLFDETTTENEVLPNTNEESEQNDKTFKTVHNKKPKKSVKKLACIITAVAILIILIVLFVALFGKQNDEPTNDESQANTEDVVTTLPATVTVVPDDQDQVSKDQSDDAARTAWLQHYSSITWVDRASVGKRDITKQGGYRFVVSDISDDNTVTFDLLSYSGNESGDTATLKGMTAPLENNVMVFSFEDDGFGHSGDGRVVFMEDVVGIEVTVNDNIPLPENVHSVAVNSEFVAQELPSSTGVDISEKLTFEEIKSVAGEATGDPVRENDMTTYSFGIMKVSVHSDNSVHAVDLDFSAEDSSSDYCFEGIDGTTTYETVKTYFGNADQDYEETPTNIRVLKYDKQDDAYLQFTFDTEQERLVSMLIMYEHRS